MEERYNEVLPLVTRPIRYTGGEYNALRREPDPARVCWVLAMPEVYELGMSNYGLRILYSILNRLDNCQCERTYVPWPDYGTILRERRMPLYALESMRPVSEFNVLGVSLQSELSCTNLLYLFDLARIPLRRTERNETHPLVVAGGPCTVNPLPMAEFVDVFIIGDGEDPVREINAAYAEWNGKDRTDLLCRIAKLEGAWVPGYTPEGATVRRRVTMDLREEDFPFPPIVPICEITHDRLTLEIARGCTRGCRFCQAGMLTRPVRVRPVEQIVRLAERGIRASGWDEVSLLSLSALDYPDLLTLIRRLNAKLSERRVAISLPSTRGEDFSAELALDLQEVKKTGLTFAPETASERLRGFVNKHISEVRILESVRNAMDAGWNGVKLYFMVGLPGETDADVAEIARFVTEVAKLCRSRQVRFNMSPFVPKPHTPLQWAGFADLGETQAKIDRLKRNINRRNIKPAWENPECSYVQALLARGDGRLGTVIERVYQKGGVFQEWTEHFKFAYWKDALAEAGVNPQDFLAEKPAGTILPWDFIDTGVSRAFLQSEYDKAQKGIVTGDCANGVCTGCGACPNGIPPERSAGKPAELEAADLDDAYGRRPRPVQSFNELKTRFRVKYAVEEQYRFAAHLDRVRAFYRSLRRSELPVAYTKGFAPKPMLSFGPPLPVGLTSTGEYMDVYTAYHYTGNIVRDLGTFLPHGLRLLAGRALPREAPTLGAIVNLGRYDITLPARFDKDFAALKARAQTINGVKELLPGPDRSVVFDLAIQSGVKLLDTLIQLFEITEPEARCLVVRRRECLAVENGRTRTPLED